MKGGHQVPTNRSTVHALPVGLWPIADRQAWEEACRPNVRLKRGGAASHMRLVVQRDLAKRYGLFLDCVVRAGRLKTNEPAAAPVTPENVAAYVTELKAA